MFGASLLGGCDKLTGQPWFKHILDKDEDANLYVQRLLLSPAKLAPEYAESDISPWFKPNGTSDPQDTSYKALAAKQFSAFRLEIDGLVNQASSFSLADLRQMPSRTQITRHDCVEGWSCIGKWTGVPLSALLNRAGLKPQARFIVFHCADTMENGLEGGDSTDGADAPDAGASDQPGDADRGTPNEKPAPKPDSKKAATPAGEAASQDSNGAIRYYESIDLEDAFHPQTILAYDMNGQTLPVAHGAPLRLRLERQLGYKMAKYVMRIEAVDSLEKFGQGGGGYWEDQGYEWYAGI